VVAASHAEVSVPTAIVTPVPTVPTVVVAPTSTPRARTYAGSARWHTHQGRLGVRHRYRFVFR
jgi:hypothetical protein